MKKISLSIFLCMFFSCTSMAASASMDGLYVSADGGFFWNTYQDNFSGSSRVLDNLTLQGGANGMLGQIAVGYSHVLVSRFNFDLQLYDSLGEAYNDQIVTWSPDNINLIQAEYKQLNTFGVSLNPGCYITKNSLVYAIVSYVRAPFEVSNPPGNYSNTLDYNGVGYGAGLRYLLSPRWSVSAAVEGVHYSSQVYPERNGSFHGFPPSVQPTNGIFLFGLNLIL